ncbi:MAG: BtrH N-terminal domain-containing protein [Thermoleophilia bacterium]
MIINGFPHKKGNNCVMSSARDMVQYIFNADITEEMICGLGAGIGFVYFKINKAAVPVFLGGMNKTFLSDLASILDLNIQEHETSSLRTGENRLLSNLNNGIPVLLQTDMYYLPYWKKNIHFGGHIVTAVGYENDEIFLLDNEYIEAQKINRSDLSNARSSKCPPLSPKHRSYTLSNRTKAINMSVAINTALTMNSERMCEPPVRFLGLPGINKLAKELIKWPDFYEPEKLAMILDRGVYQFIEKAGTGGGLFRKMYAVFLSKAASVCGSQDLQAAAHSCTKAAKTWTEVANEALALSKQQNLNASKMEDIATLVSKCEQYERECFSHINKHLGGKRCIHSDGYKAKTD